ncbi:MAG: HIT family protein [Fluviicola sp.]
MATIFSKIISGEIPCYKIAENDDFLAFLDIMPLRKGHALVIPKKETDYIFDMDDAELAAMMIFAKSVSHKIQKVFPCRKIGVTVIGLEVPHAHIHLIPINGIADMNFSQEKLTLSPEELAQIAQDIQNA